MAGAVDLLMLDLNQHLTEMQIKYIMREVLEALIYLHEQACVIHRDMKAGNILLTENGCVKLADFGVSSKKKFPADTRNTFTGTPYWMSPEVIACEVDKDKWYDTKADIWSLGITCIELAEIEPPFNEYSATRVLLKISKSDAPVLKFPHLWSKDFNSFISKCLQKNPNDRYDARALLKVFVIFFFYYRKTRFLSAKIMFVDNFFPPT